RAGERPAGGWLDHAARARIPRGGWAPPRRVTSACDTAGTGLVHPPAERSPALPTSSPPFTPSRMIAGIVLAAGFARRMGRQKLLLQLEGKPVVVPVFKGTQGTPVVFAREVFPELHRLTGDAGARSVVNARPERVERVVFDLPMPPDVDTPEDYARLHVQ